MSARSLLLVLALGLAGCATTTAPEGFLRTPAQQQTEAYGAWAEVKTAQGVDRGELIAVEPDRLYLLSQNRAGEVIAVPRTEISSVTLTTYRAQTDEVGNWTAFGCLSTLSHGFAAILSAPVWLVVGGVAGAAHSYDAQRTYTGGTSPSRARKRDQAWKALGHAARFPAGMPPELIGKPLMRKLPLSFRP